MRTISHDEQNSQTPSALRKVIISVHIHIIKLKSSHHISSYIYIFLITYLLHTWVVIKIYVPKIIEYCCHFICYLFLEV